MPAGSPPKLAVIGGGPAGLIAAEVLVAGGATVAVYERMPSLARKFLLAGRGGLNLTHGEDLQRFLTRYGRAAAHLRQAVEAFPPEQLRAWSEGLGQPTFVGTSGRVFPQAMKASPLLRTWIARLRDAGVVFHLRHRWRGWNADGAMVFDTPEGETAVRADAAILALGGASWPRLGSDGSWTEILAREGVSVDRLQPANCGFTVGWTPVFAERFQGSPLKGIALRFAERSVRGEAIVTQAGLEGGAVYALSAELREAILNGGEATLFIDLLPDRTETELVERLSVPRGKQSLSTFLRKSARLSTVSVALLQESSLQAGQRMPTDAAALAQRIKNLPVRLTGMSPIARAISTAGGVRFDAIDARFMLRDKPGVFVAGEMLDWEAPTGGYLLQACFATGAAAGRGVLDWLAAARG